MKSSLGLKAVFFLPHFLSTFTNGQKEMGGIFCADTWVYAMQVTQATSGFCRGALGSARPRGHPKARLPQRHHR